MRNWDVDEYAAPPSATSVNTQTGPLFFEQGVDLEHAHQLSETRNIQLIIEHRALTYLNLSLEDRLFISLHFPSQHLNSYIGTAHTLQTTCLIDG